MMPPASRQNGPMQRTAGIVIGLVLLIGAVVIGYGFLSSPTPQVAASPTPSASASVAASVEPSATSSGSADLLDRRWTVLYVGTDANEARIRQEAELNTDALLLASLSADQSDLTLISLPRDTVDIPLADGGTWPGKVNAIYAQEGMGVLVEAMEALYGVPIDAHVLLDMDDFSGLVEAVDGIEVSPQQPLADPIVSLDLTAGPQHIDGTTTLSYVRTRVDQDYGRMGRQQEVLVALVTKFVDSEAEIDLRAILDSLDSLETDLPLAELPSLLELARRAADAQVRNVLIRPPLIVFEGDRGDGRGYILEPDREAIRDEVQGIIGE